MADSRLEEGLGDLRALAREGAFKGRNVAAFKVFVLERVPPPMGGARVIDSNLAVFDRPAGDIGAFLRDADAFARGQGVIGKSGPMISTTVIGPIRIAGPPPEV